MPTPNFFSGMTTLQILKAVIGLGSDVQTGSIFPTWSDTVEYCKPDTFWFHEGYLYQSLKESGLQSGNGIQVPLSNFEYWKKISYTPLHMGADELEILNELNTLRIARIGAPQWATSAIAPDDHVFANGDLVYFSDRPELEEKYLSGGFDGMLLAWDATAEQQNANRGMFRPNAASPTGLYMPIDGNAYMQNWVNAISGAPGSFISAGLPNVTGGTTTYATSQHDSFSGALYGGVTVPAYGVATTNQGGLCQKIGLDISRSNSIYGASITVTPDTIKQPVIMYLGRSDKVLNITGTTKTWAATTELDNLSVSGKRSVVGLAAPSKTYSKRVNIAWPTGVATKTGFWYTAPGAGNVCIMIQAVAGSWYYLAGLTEEADSAKVAVGASHVFATTAGNMRNSIEVYEGQKIVISYVAPTLSELYFHPKEGA